MSTGIPGLRAGCTQALPWEGGSPPIYPPPHLPTSPMGISVCVRLLSEMRGLSANPGPCVSTRLGAWGEYGSGLQIQQP